MNRFQELQNKHIKLLRRYETNKESADFLKDVREYTEQVLNASREISDSRERNQLRANLRFWGAYIYDHTAVYPNLSLLPSEGKAEPLPQQPRPRVRNLGGILIGSVIFVAIVILLRLLAGNKAYSQQPSVTNTPIYPSSLFATPLGQPTNMSDVQAFATGTALALQTLKPEANPSDATVTPPGTKPPTTTPGGIVATPTAAPSTGFIPNFIYSSPTCSDRTIEIAWRDFKWDTSQLPASSEIQDAVAYLSSLGTGDIVSRVNVVPNGAPTILELDESTSDQSYLLQVRHPLFLFEPIIIQFTSDCTYNDLSITYGGQSQIVDKSTMDVELTLVDWGPDPLTSNDSWIAQLSIQQDEGGIYRYNHSPIGDGTFFVAASDCSTSPFTISRLSNGKYEGTGMSLYVAGPLCPKLE